MFIYGGVWSFWFGVFYEWVDDVFWYDDFNVCDGCEDDSGGYF